MDLQLLVFENIEKACTESSDTSVLQKNLSETDLNATCLIIYTTGTTGTPNGVMLSCENVLANIDAVSRGVEIYTKAERVMLLLPLHHIFPLLGSMVAPLYVGATVAICPALQSKDIINSLQENRITILIGVPRLYKMISKGIMTKINQKAAARLLYGFSEKMGSQSLS